MDDYDRLAWEYISDSGEAADPAEIAEVVLRVFYKGPGSAESYEHLYKACTLKAQSAVKCRPVVWS